MDGKKANLDGSIQILDAESNMKYCVPNNKSGTNVVPGPQLRNTNNFSVNISDLRARGDAEVLDYWVIKLKNGKKYAAIPPIGQGDYPRKFAEVKTIDPRSDPLVIVKLRLKEGHMVGGHNVTLSSNRHGSESRLPDIMST